MVYYRPGKPAEYFRHSHPALYKQELKQRGSVTFPCHKIPLEKHRACGPSRQDFRMALELMEGRIKLIRDKDLQDAARAKKKKSFTLKEMQKRIMRDRVATAALAYVNGAAFNSYLCV